MSIRKDASENETIVREVLPWWLVYGIEQSFISIVQIGHYERFFPIPLSALFAWKSNSKWGVLVCIFLLSFLIFACCAISSCKLSRYFLAALMHLLFRQRIFAQEADEDDQTAKE